MDKNRVAAILAISVLFGFLAVFVFLAFGEVKVANKDYFNMSLVALIGFVGTGFGYYLGSSIGSARKNEIIAQNVNDAAALPVPNPTPPATDSQAGFIRLPLMSLMSLTVLIVLLCLSGCATIGTTIGSTTTSDRIAHLITMAKRVNTVSGVLLNTAGPLTVASLCTAQPQDCTAAKAALALAQKTHNEIKAIITAAETANAAPDGSKLLSLATDFLTNMDTINSLIVAYGGQPIDLTEFKASFATLKASAASE